MDKRFALFLALAFLILAANSARIAWMRPQGPAVAKNEDAKVKQAGDKKDAVDRDKRPPGVGEIEKGQDPIEKPAENKKPDGNDRPAAKDDQAEDIEPAWVTLGSVDPQSPYRMLVTLTNRGAAVERVELSDPQYRDRDDRSGYLGHLALADAAGRKGARVRVVGKGTPAHKAGIKAGDIITAIGDQPVTGALALDRALESTKPNTEITVTVHRDGAVKKLPAQLIQRPMEVIRPEWRTKPLDIVPGPGKHDPFSFLMTLDQVGDRVLEEERDELAGVALRDAAWEIVDHDENHVTFRRQLPKHNVEITKTYELAKLPAQGGAAVQPAYHLQLKLEIKNIGEEPTTLAYRLDGPTGLPNEGWWYASKISRSMFGGGALRDVVAHFSDWTVSEVSALKIADDELEKWTKPIDFVAVDAQYFAAALIPQIPAAGDNSQFQLAKTIRVGAVPKDTALRKLTNISFRLVSHPQDVQPNQSITDSYVIFAGPKKPDLLAQYHPPQPAGGKAVASLEELVYYGWFFWVAKPMLWILHTFYDIVHNYGVAIILLTVLVRGCMFPISRKQAINAQKMQLLMPEIKKLREKYKNDLQQFGRAQQELFRKHNYNQLSGCLPLFIQMPIFIGLYRSLMVDVELRRAPLFSTAIQWCSDLAAPDMFMDWSGFMPDFITRGTGFFGLGPYLNILPLFTIVLFLWQQKLFMPPPADDQAKMQQQMMKYMMVFMGILFYKVASGLCIYFIASSLWGIAERKVLPKSAAPPAGAQPIVATRPSGDGKSGDKARRKQRGRK